VGFFSVEFEFFFAGRWEWSSDVTRLQARVDRVAGRPDFVMRVDLEGGEGDP